MPSLLPFWRLSIEVEPGIAVAEHDDAFGLAGQLVGEGRGLGAVEDAGVELVLVDDVQAERVRLLLDALVGDDHRDALVQAALERLHQADALERGRDRVGLGGDRVVDLLGVVLHRVDRVADALILPADHLAELPGADLERHVPVAERLGHPDELARRAERAALRQRRRRQPHDARCRSERGRARAADHQAPSVARVVP